MADSQATGPIASNGKRKGWRRALMVTIVILTVFVVYAFAFAKTDVSLDEIQSETRQEQLFKILRALAHPDLIHYDKRDVVIDTDVFVPCDGQDPEPAPPSAEGGTVAVTPNCANPGDEMTVRGTGFQPGQRAIIDFVPISDFDIVLPMGRVDILDDGTFELAFLAPERESPDPQIVRVTTQTNIGSWTSREKVWTDTNANGIRDDSVLPDSDSDLSTYEIVLAGFDVRVPGGVTIIDENNNVLDFISWGGAFEATTGSGKGLTSTDIGHDPILPDGNDSIQLTGTGSISQDFAWQGPSPQSFGLVNADQTPTDATDDLFFNEVAFAETNRLEIAGAPGASLDHVSLVFFDGTDGTQYRIVSVADQTDLSPRLSDNAINTWDRIVETVMLALLATTAGTMLAVPLSFLASRNLMRDVTVPVVNLAMSLIALPIGVVIGVLGSSWARSLDGLADANALTLLLALALIAAVVFFLLRWAFPPEDPGRPSRSIRTLRAAALVTVGFFALIGAYVVADLLVVIGDWMIDLIPGATFLGSFVVTLGEMGDILIPVGSALIGALALALAASKLGYALNAKLSRRAVNGLTLVLSAVAGALVAMAIGAIVDWFYLLENPLATVYIPALIGAVIGMWLSVKAIRKAESQNIGLTVYYLSRTVFNGLRSIEPLVMVIIFVVWVGIGPFAGALALALHTTAALAKLYSEQVESINSGPIEAVRATGATRLQTIVYGVIPQIVPPYISFTMYRWDINVRMSTIIGFAGGGGIGFLLQQNINLLQYRAAAAQMLAIAIVVATMDYVSSRLRERFI
ncbi:MAG: ABC transporter permease subunit [Acidimicrobiia bacterium]